MTDTKSNGPEMDAGKRAGSDTSPSQADSADLVAAGSFATPARTTRHEVIAAWVFGSILLVFHMVVFFVVSEEATQTRYQILRVLSSILSALFAFFLTGGMNLTAHIPVPKITGGKLMVQATGGFAVFFLVFYYGWPTLRPPTVQSSQLAALTLYLRRDLDDSTIEAWGLIENGKSSVMPKVAPLDDHDDFKLVGKFDRQTRWFLFWIDTAGRATVVAESDGPAIMYPAEQNKFISIAPSDPPGVHLLYLLADPEGVIAKPEAVCEQLDRLGPGPEFVQVYAMKRGPGRKRSVGVEVAEAYLNRVEAIFPDNAMPMYAVFVPWKLQAQGG